MRIIRFIEDGQARIGELRDDGSAEILLDAHGTLGPAQEQQATRQSLGGKFALVADDDLGIRQTVTGTLGRFGCEAVACEDGRQAIDAIRSREFDLVVSDIVMPHHDGYEVFAAAKEQDERTPVVLITGFGYDPAHSVVRACKRGLEGVLFKPFSPRQLVAKVSAAMWTSEVCGSLVRTGDVVQVEATLAPLEPRDLLGVDDGRRGPARPGGRLFMKPGGCVQDPGKPIRVAREGNENPSVDCRGQIAVVIGRTARSVAPVDAMEHVLGFTLANDALEAAPIGEGMSAAWLGPGCFDTSCPLGPAIVTPDDLLRKRGDIVVTTRVNGRVVRSERTRDLAGAAADLIARISARVTLRAGTVLLLPGAPCDRSAGEARANPGDEVVVEAEGIGTLANPVECA